MYYVYILARPNNKPFYVGKGMGVRVHQHEKEAQKGCECPKCQVIKRIWKSGKEVCKYIVFTTENEAEAYAYEAELIALIGRENLTNLVDGGLGARNPDPRSKEQAKLNRSKTMQQRAAESARKRDYWRTRYQDQKDARIALLAQREAEAERRQEEHRKFHDTHELQWVLDRTLAHINAQRTANGQSPYSPEYLASQTETPMDYLNALLSKTASGLRYRECGRILRFLNVGVNDLITFVPKPGAST